MYSQLFSFIGGSILCINMWPQIYKTYKCDSAKELSIMFLGLNISGLLFMDVYGFLQKDMSLYIPISLSLMNSIILVFLKIKLDYESTKNVNTDNLSL